MEAIAHSPEFAKKVGIKQSVGKDFAAADKGKTFKKGGCTKLKGGGMALFKGKESFGEELKEAKAVKSGKVSPAGFAKGEKSEGKKGEESGAKQTAMKIKMGRITPEQYAAKESKEPKGKPFAKGGGIEVRGKTKGRIV